MRKILAFASLVLLGSVIGCQHTDSGCPSCGCGGCASGSTITRHPCTFGVCDCEIPPLAPYGRNPGTAQSATQPNDPPRIMPQVNNEVSGN
jgi:hypothetical protein